MQSFLNKKNIKKVWKPKFQGEGVGAKVRRIIGTHVLNKKEMDPFLMLDHFNVKLPYYEKAVKLAMLSQNIFKLGGYGLNSEIINIEEFKQKLSLSGKYKDINLFREI